MIQVRLTNRVRFKTRLYMVYIIMFSFDAGHIFSCRDNLVFILVIITSQKYLIFQVPRAVLVSCHGIITEFFNREEKPLL